MAAERPSIFQRIKGAVFGGGWFDPAKPLAYTDSEGWLPLSYPLNYWQSGLVGLDSTPNSIVYACVMLYARTIAQLPGQHKKTRDDNGTDIITTSALSRILQKPNDYQSRSDFMQNMVVSLLEQGNAYALALRNDRFEVSELHQFSSRQSRALIGPEGEIFYALGGNQVMDARATVTDAWLYDNGRWVIPARDVLHVRGPAPKNPLIGESPLVAGVLPIAVNSGGSAHLQRFFENMARPSGVLSTTLTLTEAQVKDLRARWEEQTKGLNIGGTPILTAGLKFDPYTINSADTAIAESMKMTVADISRLFGVPLALINDMTAATFNNTEALMQMWLRQGLGFYVDNIELAFDRLFGIERGVEYTEFNIDALLRPDFKSRMEGLTKAVQGGIYAPNEARKVEGLPKAKKGDEPRVQQQLVALSWEPPPPPAPAPKPADDDKPDDEPPEDEDTSANTGKSFAAALARMDDAESDVLRLPKP
jgi:HK97 family phage portal protein